MARPPKFNKRIAGMIAHALSIGMLRDEAAAYGGISKDTYFRWLREARVVIERARREMQKLGKEEDEKTSVLDFVPKADRDKAEFAVACDRGIMTAQVRAINTITLAQKKEWTAAAWLAERLNPKRWGKRVALNGDGGPGAAGSISVVEVRLPANGRQQAREDARTARK